MEIDVGCCANGKIHFKSKEEYSQIVRKNITSLLDDNHSENVQKDMLATYQGSA